MGSSCRALVSLVVGVLTTHQHQMGTGHNQGWPQIGACCGSSISGVIDHPTWGCRTRCGLAKAPKSQFGIPSVFFTQQGLAYSLKTGTPFPWLICSHEAFEAEWNAHCQPLQLASPMTAKTPFFSGRSWSNPSRLLTFNRGVQQHFLVLLLLSLHTDPQNTRKRKMQPKSTVMVCASQPRADVAGHHSHFGVGRYAYEQTAPWSTLCGGCTATQGVVGAPLALPWQTMAPAPANLHTTG